jgi:hypothetical protein
MPGTPRNAPESETRHEKQIQQNSQLLSQVVIHACRPPYACKESAVVLRGGRERESVQVSRVVPSSGGVGSLIADAITPTRTLGDKLLRARRMTVEVCFAGRLCEIVSLG